MLSPNIELALRDIARRLNELIDQVKDGEAVDSQLLEELNIMSRQCYVNHVAGHEVTIEEIQYMGELIDLLEMRTTLIYKNPPEM